MTILLQLCRLYLALAFAAMGMALLGLTFMTLIMTEGTLAQILFGTTIGFVLCWFAGVLLEAAIAHATLLAIKHQEHMALIGARQPNG